ncbi:MAG: pantoate--beta-alanine ligase [Candidatus Pelagibacter sp.]
MEIIKNILDLNKAIKDFKNFGFVPTMGGIHQGHISLIKNSQKMCKKTIVSIFVNPTQFNDKVDYKKYPRNIKRDIKILENFKVDFLFIPQVKEIYKKKIKSMKLNNKDKILCAKFRKGHFEGVLNVMNRLMSIIKANKIFMGEKDFQQVFLINKYLSKKYKSRIVSCETIRDKKSVALSTRHKLLSKKNYIKISLITKNLLKLKKKINLTDKYLLLFINKYINKLEKFYKIKVDYLEFRNEKNLKLTNSKKKCRLFIAYTIDKVRLIDNFQFTKNKLQRLKKIQIQ